MQKKKKKKRKDKKKESDSSSLETQSRVRQTFARGGSRDRRHCARKRCRLCGIRRQRSPLSPSLSFPEKRAIFPREKKARLSISARIVDELRRQRTRRFLHNSRNECFDELRVKVRERQLVFFVISTISAERERVGGGEGLAS